MAYTTDNTIGTCKNGNRCTVKPVPGLFHAIIRLIGQPIKKAANNKVQRHFQAQMSYPAQRPVPHGAEFHPWRCRVMANVFAKPQKAKFAGLVIFCAILSIFAKVQFYNKERLIHI